MQVDTNRLAFDFAVSFKDDLADIYSCAFAKYKLPSLENCMPDLKALIAECAGFEDLVDDRNFLFQVHLHGRQKFIATRNSSSKNAKIEEELNDKLKKIDFAIEKHRTTLYRKLKRAIVYDDYGTKIEDNRSQVFIDFLQSQKIITGEKPHFSLNSLGNKRLDSTSVLISHCKEVMGKYEEILHSQGSGRSNSTQKGLNFEIWVEETLYRLGWSIKRTSVSGDQGVDLIAGKGEFCAAIQCKDYEGSVGNKAVQEVVAGMRHYGIDQGVVVSQGAYTRGAKDLAASNEIHLLSPPDLFVLFDLLKNKKIS